VEDQGRKPGGCLEAEGVKVLSESFDLKVLELPMAGCQRARVWTGREIFGPLVLEGRVLSRGKPGRVDG
jgi:hypothetical protein